MLVSVRRSCRPVRWKVSASWGDSSRERQHGRPVPHASTANTNDPKKRTPPHHHPHCRQHYNNRLPFIISTTSLFVCRLVCAVINTIQSSGYLHPRDTFGLFVFPVARRLKQVSQLGCHRCPFRRACQANVGPFGARPKPATDALSQHTDTERWCQSA
jgi:hypothetical protein